jgi:response regulator RpfG family c-di-GMP phosphodiesterase
VAILIPEDQREIWKYFLDEHKEIISVIRPVLDQKVYSLLHEANQEAHGLLQKLRADVKPR